MNDSPAPASAPTSAPAASAASTVDERNPWLGLASFTEETRAYFYGRDEEVAELSRRVQRKLLTVLFGQSGLGKTSILRAGLVPRLRGQGYCDAERAQRAALLREAAALVDGLPATLKSLHDVRQWRELIRAAERGAA